MMPPKRGEGVYRGAMARLQAAMNPKMRGEEMMRGVQKKVLEGVVWGGGGGGGGSSSSGGGSSPDREGFGQDAGVDYEMMYEVTVRPGDMLFMPLGWWHSVKSVGEEGGINGSVNWWFR